MPLLVSVAVAVKVTTVFVGIVAFDGDLVKVSIGALLSAESTATLTVLFARGVALSCRKQ